MSAEACKLKQYRIPNQSVKEKKELLDPLDLEDATGHLERGLICKLMRHSALVIDVISNTIHFISNVKF